MSPGAGAGGRNRIFLHVGSPKTGTTFLQQVLWSQRRLARQQGLLLPLNSFFEHFLASLDVRDLADRPEHPPRAVGIWAKAVRQARAWDGPVLISHELFASASAEQARRAIAAFGEEADVHVVLTARDLVRQIPAEWQEHLKHRSKKTFSEFVQSLQRDSEGASWFWRVQDFADVVARWGKSLPPDRVHVVTVPPAGADPAILWTRFATMLGLDPESFDTEASRSNTSLGAEQAELLRRVNAELGKRLPLPGPYAADVKNVFAQRVLAQRPGTRFGLDVEGTEFAIRRSREIAIALDKQQIDVIGDLEELVPSSAPVPTGTGHVSTEALLTESIAALAGLLDEHRARRLERDAERRTHNLFFRDLKERPIRFLLIRATERRPWLMKARRVYQMRGSLAQHLRQMRQRLRRGQG
ncbi:MAG: hypothetical protein M3393_06705 [Actinomycetota bacterium]|nr:hypothetical protein [Actinomycetota bacterium]